MIKSHTFILVLLVVIIPSISFSQDIDGILKSHFEAWGQEHISTIRTFQLDVTETKGLLNQTKYQITRKRPNKLRVDGLWKDKPYINAFDGTEYWTIAPWRKTEEAETMTDTEIEKLSKTMTIDSPLFLALKDSIEMEYLGLQTSDDVPYHVIRMSHLEDRWLDYFVDQLSFQIFKTVERDQGNEKYVYQETFFKGYKPQAGINMVMEYEIRGRESTTNLIIREVILGHGAPNSFFSRPTN